MRATTLPTPKFSRATRAETMLELSPLLTAAKASVLLDSGLEQGVPVEADPGDGGAAEVGAQAPERVRVLVDDDDRVTPSRRARWPASSPLGRSP